MSIRNHLAATPLLGTLAALVIGLALSAGGSTVARATSVSHSILIDTPTPGPVPTCRAAWTLVLSPTLNLELEQVHFWGMDSTAANDVWAVGDYLTRTQDSPQGQQPQTKQLYNNRDRRAKQKEGGEREVNLSLIDHWDGSRWTVITGTNAGAGTNILYSVDAISPNDVWAAGFYLNSFGVAQTLVKHWNGTAWSIVPSPNSSPLADNQFFAIKAVAPNDIWAVGAYSDDDPAFRTLTAHWDGVSWSVVASPNQGAEDNTLYDVAVASANDVWAVGSYRRDTYQNRGLTMHWDGTAWTIVPNPGVGSHNNAFYAVTAVASNDVWAVGVYYNYYGEQQSLIEHWDGAAWNVVAAPAISAYSSALLGVVARASDDVWAVGSSFSREYGGSPLILRWNGTEWTNVRGANLPPSYGDKRLSGVTALSATNVWAAGTYGSYSYRANTGLIEQYSTACVQQNCRISFTDVRPSDYYYFPARYLYCQGALSGYGDNTLRPGNNVTRAQMCKIVVLAEGWSLRYYGDYNQDFIDVSRWDNPFFAYIEEAYERGIVSGYSDHTFRPGNAITRGQLCKVITLAQEWAIDTTGGPHFTDVPPSDPFYAFIEILL